MRDVLADIVRTNFEYVRQDTWGHLAPVKDKSYSGRLVFAVGCFGNDPINPTPIVFEFDELGSSPWLFEAIQDMSYELIAKTYPEGTVVEWAGTVCNYVFSGDLKVIFNANKS